MDEFRTRPLLDEDTARTLLDAGDLNGLIEAIMPNVLKITWWVWPEDSQEREEAFAIGILAVVQQVKTFRPATRSLKSCINAAWSAVLDGKRICWNYRIHKFNIPRTSQRDGRGPQVEPRSYLDEYVDLDDLVDPDEVVDLEWVGKDNADSLACLNERLALLSERQREIVRLAADGRTQVETAEHLKVSLRTVQLEIAAGIDLCRLYDLSGSEPKSKSDNWEIFPISHCAERPIRTLSILGEVA